MLYDHGGFLLLDQASDLRDELLNKKKKSTNTSPYPDEVIDRLARAFYPAILACWNSEEGQRSLVGARPLHLAAQDRSVAQKPHWGFCCCANASLPMAGGTGSSCPQQRETERSRLLGIRKTVFEK
jgi:hypothetical protein